MTELTTTESLGLYRAAQAEHASRRAASEALHDFGAVAVFEHLRDSAARHIDTICDLLHTHGSKPPVLALVSEVHHDTIVEALNAAAERETQTAAIYDEVLQSTKNQDLKSELLPIFQSVSHLHLTAIADHLALVSPPN